MTLYQKLDRYRAATRQALLCAEALPELTAWQDEYQMLPGQRPDDLNRETRYVLAAYRAALAEQAEIRAWLLTNRAEMWLAAAEAEAALLWQIERAGLDDELQPHASHHARAWLPAAA